MKKYSVTVREYWTKTVVVHASDKCEAARKARRGDFVEDGESEYSSDDDITEDDCEEIGTLIQCSVCEDLLEEDDGDYHNGGFVGKSCGCWDNI